MTLGQEGRFTLKFPSPHGTMGPQSDKITDCGQFWLEAFYWKSHSNGTKKPELVPPKISPTTLHLTPPNK